MKILKKISALILAGALLFATPAPASEFKVDRSFEDSAGSILSLSDTQKCDVEKLMVGIPEELKPHILAARVYLAHTGQRLKGCYIELDGLVIAYDENEDLIGRVPSAVFKRPVKVGS